MEQWSNICLVADADEWSYYLNYSNTDALNSIFIVSHVLQNIAIKSGHIKDETDALIKHVHEEDKRHFLRSQFARIENYIPKTALNVEMVNGDIPNRGLLMINESGLYALVLSSKLKTACDFKRWVTHEVIPTIRKTGSYSLAGTNQQSALQANDVKAIAKLVAKELKAQQAKEVRALLPKGNCIYVSTTDYEALQYIRETVHWMERIERKDFLSVVRDFVRALVL